MYFYLLMNGDFLLVLIVSNQFLPPVKAEVWKCFKFVVKPGGLKCRSQATGQVTGHRPGHRSDHRPQVRSQVRSQATGQVTGQITGHTQKHTQNCSWLTFYYTKIEQAKEPQLYFFCSELYQIPHMRKYIHVDHARRTCVTA